MDYLEKAQAVNEWVVALRRDFHMHPEASGEEVRTAEIVERELKNLGISVRRIGKTGILGELVGGLPGKVVAMRADMDALSVTEETGLEFSSRTAGMMHACGHDMHTSMLLGAAKVLAGMKAEIPGTVKFIFQPAEEIASGAKWMVEGGVMENPRVDMAYAMHIMNDIPTGKAAVQEGLFMASADVWNLTIKGVSAHGSSPWLGVDAITCAAAIIQSLQTVVSRINDARNPIVINIGTIQGGERFNVIPGKVELGGMNRAFTHESRNAIPKHMEDIIKHTCEAYRCEYDLKYNFLCSPTLNDPQATATAKKAVTPIFGAENIITVEKMMGSEDFSEYIVDTPGMLMFLGVGLPEGKNHSLHSNLVVFNEEGLPFGVASYASFAMTYLQDAAK